MTTFMKKLWQDKRGNALIIASGALPLLVGSVGLATDTVQWVTWKRQLQRAADSAALAGVYARFQGQGANTAVTRDLASNNHVWVPLSSGYPQVSEPTDTSAYTKQVEVSLAVQRSLTFSSMFMASAPVIRVTARAAAIDSGTFCVIAKETDPSEPGIIIQGSAFVSMGCGMISNSPAASVSVDVIGGGHNVTAEPVAGVGGVENITGVTNEQSYHLAQPDPYENQHSTDIPDAAKPCKANMAAGTVGGIVQPGCYNSFDPGDDTQLAPGVYYLNNATLDMQGNESITGTGVTLIFTGTDPGHLEMNGNSSLNLTAPTATTCGVFGGVNSCDYTNMLMIQSAAADIRNDNLINGNSDTQLDGVMYFPNAKLTFTGSSGPSTKCAMIVGRVVHFSGSTNVQNNTTGCVADEKATGKAIRLIA